MAMVPAVAIIDFEAFQFGSTRRGRAVIPSAISAVQLWREGEDWMFTQYSRVIRRSCDVDMVSERTGLPRRKVQQTADFVTRLTGLPLVDDREGLDTFERVVVELDRIREQSGVVMAKGVGLEHELLERDDVQDLTAFGCPRFPSGVVHDPSVETLYFAIWLAANWESLPLDWRMTTMVYKASTVEGAHRLHIPDDPEEYIAEATRLSAAEIGDGR